VPGPASDLAATWLRPRPSAEQVLVVTGERIGQSWFCAISPSAAVHILAGLYLDLGRRDAGSAPKPRRE
jgi:hypothetical protein